MKKIKVLFVAPHLGNGGAERITSILVSHLDRNRFIPILALFSHKGDYLKNIPADVQILNLNTRARYGFLSICKVIRNIKPDIVFSAVIHINYLISFVAPFIDKRTKLISYVPHIISDKLSEVKYQFVERFFLNMHNISFHKVVCQCQYMKDDLISNFKLSPKKTVVINNPVDSDFIKMQTENLSSNLYPKDKFKLLAVGRLAEVKRYDYMLRALALLDDKYHLTILGRGPLETELIEYAKRLGITNRVEFLGFKENPYSYMANADLFLLSSSSEGFPNAVLEANTCGLPVVSFSIPSVAEIVKNGVNGLLAEPYNIEMFAEKIREACNADFDKNVIKQMTYFRYNVQTILNQYEQTFLEVIG